MDIQNIYEFGPANGQAPKNIVFLLHGLGSNGQDLISLAPMWAQHMPDTIFLSPDAPFPCDMVPPGYPNAYQWFSLQDRNPDTMLQGVKTAAPIVQKMVDEQCAKYDIVPEQCILAGFSQGTMMSLYVASRYKNGIAGVLGYSGALISDPEEDEGGLNKIPVHLVHGEADDVVPVLAWNHAKEILEKSGFKVSGHTTPGLTHSIDQQGIDSGLDFMKSILK